MLPLPREALFQNVFLLLIGCLTLFLVNEVRSEGRIVCYYTNWSVYRPGTAKFNPQNINPYLCTHLVYAFGGFTKDNQMKPFDKYQDIEQGGYAKFTGLKTYNKQLKTMIAIGGWNEASSRFSPLVANAERRQKFIKNILKFLRQNHFDGIDLDWEYPAHREGGKPRDRDNYAQFVQELRAEFERESEKTGRTRLLITMAVPAGIEYIEKGYDIPTLNKYLDWFNLLTYDFHSSHEPSVNHHAPLYSLEEESEYNYDTELNIDYSLKFYLKAGADRDKLVLGIPTYGRSYTLINEESTEIGAPAEGPGEQGDATREKGYLAYYEICQNIKEDPEWTVVQPNPNAMGPYAYKRNQWVGYDDEEIVRKKAQYAVEHGLGGIMFWAIDNDDFRGTCTGKPYPLIEAAKEALLDGLGLGINEVPKGNGSPKKPLRSRSRENSSSSSRNRISDNESRKAAGRRPVSEKRKALSSESPKTAIKLTEPEGSSLYVGGRTTTPPPPTTPDPGTDFKCEEEGFFQHPRDCKKYYWCLDSGPSGLGIVGHQFTCPSGLYFNPAADSCDFARNVPCKIKKSTAATTVTTTTTTSTPRTTTTSSNRITAATSRNSFLRSTTKKFTTTTANVLELEDSDYEEDKEEEEEEEQEEGKSVSAQNKDRDPEEDPKVIKELIDLIRKVGGIEELEKHLLRKEDGSISLKEQKAGSADATTTPSPIAKTLYDKVLSRPNTYNSFRNRLTSSTLYKNNAQSKTDVTSAAKAKKHDQQNEQEEENGESKQEDIEVGRSVNSYSKYSSVVRGNIRQGPQNEGLERLPELEGLLKEKKQYVTINRSRNYAKTSNDFDIDNDDEDEEKQSASVNDYRQEKDTSKPTLAYNIIQRTRSSSSKSAEVTTTTTEPEPNDRSKVERESYENKLYTPLNRSRNRSSITEIPDLITADDVISTTTRYKYFERTRPTKSSISYKEEEKEVDDEATNDYDVMAQNEQNVMIKDLTENDTVTQNSQTTRLYASIGRRTTTTTTPPVPTTTTTTTPTTPASPAGITEISQTVNLLKKNSFEMFESLTEAPEPVSTITTTTTTLSSTKPFTLYPNSIATELFKSNLLEFSSPPKSTSEIITTPISAINSSFAPSTPFPSIFHTISTPLSTTSTVASSISDDDDFTVTTRTLDSSENALLLSRDENTLAPKISPTTQFGLDTNKQRDSSSGGLETTKTLNEILSNESTRTDLDTANVTEKVTNFNENFNKTLLKYTKTRSRFSTTKTPQVKENETSDIPTTNITPTTNAIRSLVKSNRNSFNNSNNGNGSNNVLRGNSIKYTGGRRQQQQQQQQQIERIDLSNRKYQNQLQQTSTGTPNDIVPTTTTTPNTNNDNLGTVSSPRPFGFPRRRTRPSSITATTIPPSTDESSRVTDDDVELNTSVKSTASVKKQRSTTTATPNTNSAISRRPVLSVRRRLINSSSAQSPTTPQTSNGIYNKNKYNNNNNDFTTTELPATSKFNVNNNNNKNKNGSYLRGRPRSSSSSSSKTNTKTKSADLSLITNTTTNTNYNKNNENYQQNPTGKYKTKSTSDLNVSSSYEQTTVADDQQKKYPSSTLRRKFQQRRITSTPAASTSDDESVTEQQRTPNPLFKRRYGQTLDSLRLASTTATALLPHDSLTTTIFVDGFDNDEDQVAKSSIHACLFNRIPIDEVDDGNIAGTDADADTDADVDNGDVDTDDDAEKNNESLGNVGVAELDKQMLLSAIKTTTTKPMTTTAKTTITTGLPDQTIGEFLEIITRRIDVGNRSTGNKGSNGGNSIQSPPTELKVNKGRRRRPQSDTPNPVSKQNVATRASNTFNNRRRPLHHRSASHNPMTTRASGRKSQAIAARTYRPIFDYDYYDDGDVPVVGSPSQQQIKVVLHGGGIIECLDQGNFPHPLSCRKFISCAKFETGGVVGWEYTCPKGLSYDPVGGMCNWAAGLGCKEQ